VTLSTRCDGCGRPFEANAWNQRTCVACEVAGFPDQSKDEWNVYLKRSKAWHLARREAAAARLPRRSQLPHKRIPARRTGK
jgi:hypothetical protein